VPNNSFMASNVTFRKSNMGAGSDGRTSVCPSCTNLATVCGQCLFCTSCWHHPPFFVARHRTWVGSLTLLLPPKTVPCVPKRELQFLNNPNPTHNILSTPTTADKEHVPMGMQSRPAPTLMSQSMMKEPATDKQQIFTKISTTNKGRKTANNTSKRHFPTPMFHQKNGCFCMQIRKLCMSDCHAKCSMFDPMFQQSRHLHWQD